MRFRPDRLRLLLAAPVLLFAGCGGDVAPSAPLMAVPVADVGSKSVSLIAGSTAAEYMAVVANTALDGTTSHSFTIQAAGAAAASRVGSEPATMQLLPQAVLVRDVAFESRLRARERVQLTPRIAGARAWYSAREVSRLPQAGLNAGGSRGDQAIPADARLGDLVRVNVQSDSACRAPIYHTARVMAIGTHAIVLEDTLNPRNGFSTADFQRFATRFDTLVFPLDSAAFGAPTDIDHNGHIALVFTSAVNMETARGAGSYVGGFAFSRDLFPIAGSSRTQPCAGSNEGEYFYLLAPDPQGTINGNPRSTSFVDSITPAIIAHEFEHLINSGRRLYVNSAPAFEAKWLDEGLAHIAEELLFYRESGLRSRSNIDVSQLRSTTSILYAYNRDMLGNQGRYRIFLQAPSRNSPFGMNDDLATRGATWSLLRYLSDQAGSADGDIFFRLVNSRSIGTENLAGVFGTSVSVSVRDWNVSHAADDISDTPAFQQRSWNWHSIFPAVTAGGQYPLQYQLVASGTTYSGSVLSGGAAYYKIVVPANSTATLSLVEQSSAQSTLSLVTVRTK